MNNQTSSIQVVTVNLKIILKELLSDPRHGVTYRRHINS